MLLTVLGELVLPSGEPARTTSLLYVLKGMGVAEPAARMAVTRAGEAGWIEGEKHGREVRWALTESGLTLIAEITERVLSLNTAPQHWDGNGIFLNVIVPREKAAVRKRLYNALRWAGFGNPAPALWTNPHVDRLDEAKAIVEELGLRESTIVAIGRLADMGLTAPEIIVRAWNLDEVAARYAELLDIYDGMHPEPGDDVLFSYLALVDQWRTFPAIDPQLPRDVLPDWIGRRAADTFVKLRRQWAPAARVRWHEVAKLSAPNLPDVPAGSAPVDDAGELDPSKRSPAEVYTADVRPRCAR